LPFVAALCLQGSEAWARRFMSADAFAAGVETRFNDAHVFTGTGCAAGSSVGGERGALAVMKAAWGALARGATGRSVTATRGGSQDFGQEGAAGGADGATIAAVANGTRTMRGGWERAIMWPAMTAPAPAVTIHANAKPSTSVKRDVVGGSTGRSNAAGGVGMVNSAGGRLTKTGAKSGVAMGGVRRADACAADAGSTLERRSVVGTANDGSIAPLISSSAERSRRICMTAVISLSEERLCETAGEGQCGTRVGADEALRGFPDLVTRRAMLPPPSTTTCSHMRPCVSAESDLGRPDGHPAKP